MSHTYFKTEILKLKLKRSLGENNFCRNGHPKTLRVCTPNERISRLSDPSVNVLGFSGLGSMITNETHLAIPLNLQEMVFSKTDFDMASTNMSLPCPPPPPKKICVRPHFEKGNICQNDDGGPLFQFKCGSLNPKCVYGVASYSVGRLGHRCNAGSYFTDVTPFYEWIQEIIFRYPD